MGWITSDNTKTPFPMYDFVFFHVFKMAVAIAFLCENAVEAIQISSISMILSLNCFYIILAKKRNRHGHFKCIKIHWLIHDLMLNVAIMLCSIFNHFMLTSTTGCFNSICPKWNAYYSIKNALLSHNKIEGTPILKLAMVKR